MSDVKLTLFWKKRKNIYSDIFVGEKISFKGCKHLYIYIWENVILI